MCPPALNSLLPGLRGHSIRVQWNYKSQGMLPVRSTRVFPCPHIGFSQLLDNLVEEIARVVMA